MHTFIHFYSYFKTGFLISVLFYSITFFTVKLDTHSLLHFKFTMKFTNIVLAASAATVACAYPQGRDVVPTKQSANIKKRANGFTWVGVSESGAEFGSNIPGTLDQDYAWPKTSQIQILRDAGMNIFRVPFLMERLVPTSITGTPDATYLAALKSVCDISIMAIDSPTPRSNGSIL